MLALLKRTWKNWKALTHNINTLITWVLMGIAYLLAVGPVALYFRLTRDDLIDRGLGDPHADSYWRPLPPDEEDIRRAQRPW